MLVSRLPEFDLLDLGRTFLYVHFQNFTLGLRLETLALSCSDVTSGDICCIIGPILSTSTFTATLLNTLLLVIGSHASLLCSTRLNQQRQGLSDANRA